jgi:hypothetical protein
MQDEIINVKLFLALSRGTCDPFQLSIFPFGLYQTTRQALHHLTRSFFLQRQDIDLLEEICNCLGFLMLHVSIS